MPFVRLLGPVDVIDDHGVVHTPRSALRRTLLALLALQARTVIDAERLLDAAWNGRPPESGVRALRFHISRMRAEIGIDDLIVTVGRGYRLDADTDVVLVTGRIDQCVDVDALGTLLGTWRAAPFQDASTCVVLDHERRRLDDLRLTITERHSSARAERGDSTVIGDLTRLCLDHPVRESLWAILINGHYRAGNQADALRTLTRLRVNLRDELGVGPSLEIRDLEQRILEHDPELHPRHSDGPGQMESHDLPTSHRLATPDTRFARVGKLRIAYQEFGAGPRTVLIPPLTSNIDVGWDHEFYRRMLEHLGSYLRVVQFDKRGIGVSDRFDEQPTLDDRISDIAAVMDAVGWDHANLFGLSEGASMAQHFAVRYPNRVDKLALLGGAAPAAAAERVRLLSGPAHRDGDEIAAELFEAARTWGEDAVPWVKLMAPSQLGNPSYLRWSNRMNRLSASPADFVRQLQSIVGIADTTEPKRVGARTIVLHLTGDRCRPIGNARVLAELIPQSTLVEVDGTDHLMFCTDRWRELLDPVIEFFTGTRPPIAVQRRFATLMFADIVGSTTLNASIGDARWRELIEEHHHIVHRATAAYGGRVIGSTFHGLFATFESPSAATHMASDARTALGDVGLSIRVGIHAGEVEEHSDGNVSGLAVDVAAQVQQAAPDGAIFVSSMVGDLLFGSGARLTDRGVHALRGVDGACSLFEMC